MQIQLESITKQYDGVDPAKAAVSSISATIGTGEFFFLLGPSGCGKTTLLRMIAGLILPTSGRVLFDGVDVTYLPVDKRGAAMVFQGYALWPHMTVRDNVEFGPRMKGLPRDERRRIAIEQLDRVEMTEFADRKPNQLSGGQQQRVALARALAAGTRCLLFDEPLSNLDARLRLHMRDELRELVKSTGVTAIYVTHDQKEALSMADRIAVMNAGQIAQLDTPEAVYNRPATRFVADFLGEANFLDGEVAATDPVRVKAGTRELKVQGSEHSEAGAPVTCCVRPEHVIIQRAEDPVGENTDNTLPASILSSIYLGDVRQYVCRLEEHPETIWRVAHIADGRGAMSPGDPVNLNFAAGQIALLKR